MLDTNTISYILKGLSPLARRKLNQLGPQDVACISVITAAELWYGLEHVGAGEQRRHALRLLLSRIKFLPWDSQEAEAYGRFRAYQESIGRPLGPLDMQIAAHAISVGAIVVSNDAAFRNSVGLPGLESWATDV